ncbi:hypothetical protein V5O48_014970 [Marasmius crinis-equi]|uniref:GH16 domain-containing protein n=1 Tax=Marasmius crinis-equi TaxID=585013 RepID=A0ABR3EVT6_9AGAR
MKRITTITFFISLSLIPDCWGLYTPWREYAGTDFFNGWDYFGNVDNTTWGNVSYVDEPTASSQRLAYVDQTTGHAIIRVDNTTNIPTDPPRIINRPSVKITSKDTYDVGSLIIFDATHMPFGCSVWPSFWTLGVGAEWPNAGEIDVVEGINNLPFNQMALHTTNGCFQAANPGQSGKTATTNCTLPEGCLVQETKPNSFGADFAKAGGGVWALQFDVAGVFIWFWSRPNVPKSVAGANRLSTMDLKDWGAPSASYPAAACNIQKFFQPQKLVIDITLCGTWAGIPSIYAQTCGAGTCISNVFGNGSNYGNAWWDISYIRTYLAVDPNPKPSTSSSASSTGAQSTTTGTGGTNTAAGSNSAVDTVLWPSSLLLVGVALAVSVWALSL